MASLSTDQNQPSINETSENTEKKLSKINAIISKAKSGNTEVNLANCDLSQFPLDLLGCPNIRHLILRGNSLEALPEDLFERLPALEWLDLRDNRLSDLPHIPLVSATSQTLGSSVAGESVESSTSPASPLPLRNLLLSRNRISALPLEIGIPSSFSRLNCLLNRGIFLVNASRKLALCQNTVYSYIDRFLPYLVGLNLEGNPLVYPPADIVRRGTQSVLRHLRNALLSKTNSTTNFSSSFISEQQQPSDTLSGADLSTAHTSAASSESHKRLALSRASGGSSRVFPLALHQMRGGAGVSGGKPPSPILSVREPPPEPLLAQLAAQLDDEHVMQMSASAAGGVEGGIDGKSITRSAVLHAHLNSGQIRQIYMQRLKNAALAPNGVTKLKPKPSEHRVNLFPAPPPLARVDERARTEQADAARRRDLENIDRKLQKVKNADYVSDWKDKTKQLQRTRNAEQRRRPLDEIAAESKGRIKAAPFDIGDELAVQSNEERIQGRLLPHVVEKPRPMSPNSLVQRDRQQRAVEEDLKQRVEEHTEAVRKRVQRRKAAERGGDDLRTAQYDLEIAHRLRRELETRRRELESQITEFKL